MLRFSNDDYSTPRDRIVNQRFDAGTKYNCDGTPRVSGCGSVAVPTGCADAPLASVYAPKQQYAELFDPMTALCSGTLFKQLYKPLSGGNCNG